MSENQKNINNEVNLEKKDKHDKPNKPKKPSVFKRMGNWVSDFRGEAKKITWPTKKQVLNNTLVVFAVVLVVGAFIWIMDPLFKFGLSALSSIFGA